MNKIKFKKEINALSLFSNVGVAETYLKNNGINVCIANEIDPLRCKFYKHLYPNTDVICGDITDRNIYNSIIDKSCKNNIDFIIATPPCQGMSCAGKKDPFDPRNFLIYYAIQIVKKIKPKFVIFENVRMQKNTKIKINNNTYYIPEYVEEELSDCYNFNKKRIINTMDYGIPQSRERYIYLLVNKSENLIWEFPKPNNKIITLRDAIGDLPSLDPDVRELDKKSVFPNFLIKKEAGLAISKWHKPPTHSWKQVEWMMHTPTGKSAFQNKTYYPKTKGRRIKGAPRTYMRMSWDKPATTIMQNSGVISAFSTVHPGRKIQESSDDTKRLYSDPRVLTIYELLILSSLPLNWDIPEWAEDSFIRKVIGEGIPPLLIEKAVRSLIDSGKYDR